MTEGICCFFLLFESLNPQNIAKDSKRKLFMFSVSRGSSVSGRSEMRIKMINAQTEVDIDIPHISLLSQTCCINA